MQSWEISGIFFHRPIDTGHPQQPTANTKFCKSTNHRLSLVLVLYVDVALTMNEYVNFNFSFLGRLVMANKRKSEPLVLCHLANASEPFSRIPSRDSHHMSHLLFLWLRRILPLYHLANRPPFLNVSREGRHICVIEGHGFFRVHVSNGGHCTPLNGLICTTADPDSGTTSSLYSPELHIYKLRGFAFILQPLATSNNPTRNHVFP
jgi:hypothetical protein